VTKEELIERLKAIVERQECLGDGYYAECEDDHLEADKLLLKYIDEEEVTHLFESIERWYS